MRLAPASQRYLQPDLKREGPSASETIASRHGGQNPSVAVPSRDGGFTRRGAPSRDGSWKRRSHRPPRDLRESLRDEAVARLLPLKPKALARPTQAPSFKLQPRVVERTRNNLRPTRRKDEEATQREHTECIRQSDLEDWLADNQPLFDKLDVQVNMDLVLDVFNEKKEPLPFEERMLQGNEFFNLRCFPKYSPHAGDRIGLFLRLLHHNMPMVSVAPVWSPKYNAWKPPTSSTVSGFVCLFTPRFKEVLGESPSLWKWQTAAEWFLRTWCPDGKINDVRWNDATREGGIWSLTTFECRQIAYVTTHQYACVLLQYNALSS